MTVVNANMLGHKCPYLGKCFCKNVLIKAVPANG
jgi:hypothetical protein